MELKLALVLLASVAVNANADCCYRKTFSDSSYTLMESGSQEEADEAGCDTVGGCIYIKDGTSDRYCFKMGGLEVPGCEQEPCDEFFVMILRDGQGVGRFVTESVDANATCVLPSFDAPENSQD